MHKYRNPWFKEFGDHGPEFYVSRVHPAEYRGFQIFHRHEGMWELVKDGVCLTQRAGRKGMLSLADALLGDESEEPQWLVERAREIAVKHGVSIPRKKPVPWGKGWRNLEGQTVKVTPNSISQPNEK